MALILAAMIALTTISATMNAVPIDHETDTTYQVWYRGSVNIGVADPENVEVHVYNNVRRLIASGWCESDYTFCVGTTDGTRYVTDDVRIVLTDNYNDTRVKLVPDMWGSYTWYINPSRWEHNAGVFDFSVFP